MGGTSSVSTADGIHVAKGSAIGVGFPGWEIPTHIADSGCNRTCVGTKIGMRNFVRKDVKILLGDNGLSWMMARGYGDIGELKGALFVPGLTKDLISTAQFDLEGKSDSTQDRLKTIWDGEIGTGRVVMQFRLDMTDLLYHWVDPYLELALHRKAGMISSKVQGNASKTVREDWSCTDNRLKVRDKIRKMTSERNGQKVLDETGTDPNLEKLVRKEVKRYLRGSRGVQSAESTLNLNKLQLLHTVGTCQ
jgi:hypothetical protein